VKRWTAVVLLVALGNLPAGCGGSHAATILGDGAVGGDSGGGPGCGVSIVDATPTPFGYALATSNLEVDALAIYWIDEGGRVLRLPKVGGSPQVLAVQQAGALATTARNLELSDDAVYFVDSDSVVGFIKRVSKNGGAVTTLATTDFTVDMLQLDASAIYFRTRWQAGSPAWKVPLDGGQPIPLATTLDLTSTPDTGYLASDGANLYFTVDAGVFNSGAVYRLAKDGSAVTAIATGVDEPWQLTAADPDFLYFDIGAFSYDATTQQIHLGKIARVPKNADAAVIPEIVATDQLGPKQIVVDGANLYWINSGGGTSAGSLGTSTVMRAVKPAAGQDGGSASALALLAECDPYSQELAVDDTSVYYLDWHGNLRKLAK
jgi:hypothetical protein